MTLPTFVFVDLDDTLFQTLHKCAEGDHLEPVGFLKDGSPLSYSNARQRTFLEAMRAMGTVIPTTARDLGALGRVRLEFDHVRIAAHGAVVLDPGGALDREWADRVQAWAEGSREVLETLLERIQARIHAEHLDLKARLVGEHHQIHYFLAKSRSGDLSDLDSLERSLAKEIHGTDLRIHRNGNNLALLPGWLGKEFAVEWVRSRYLPPEALLLGVGDSLTDLPFMRSCDYLVVPARSQIVRERLTRPSDA
ncbi:MAG TPA: haloacid dehalogenase [Fibrobacteria bacterium]|nr:haloacid dehalogenase [Fibrobacteria bacterium]HOX51098.1 haloacid dehalogenase [Fibrobacteria bacterium]